MQNEVEIRITMKDEQNLRPNSTDTPQKQLSAVLPRTELQGEGKSV